MSDDYTPHSWVVVNITNNGQTFNKVLAGWSGGYLDGDYWRMNSGITAVREEPNHWLFYGASVLHNLLAKNSDTVNSVVLDENTDWRSIAVVAANAA